MAKTKICCALNSDLTFINITNSDYIAREPSVVTKVNEETFVGTAALQLKHRQRNVNLIYPIDEGCVTNVKAAASIIKGMLDNLLPSKMLLPRLDAGCVIPSGLNTSDKKMIQNTFINVGVRQIRFLEIPICVMRIANHLYNATSGIILDLGHSCSDIAAVINGKLVCGATLALSGKQLNKLIKKAVDDKYEIDLPPDQVDLIRNSAISMYPNDSTSAKVTALNSALNRYEVYNITSRELYTAVCSMFDNIVMVIKSILNTVSEFDLTLIKDNGIFVSGSQAKISGLDKYLYEQLNLPVTVIDDAEFAAMKGARLIITDQVV